MGTDVELAVLFSDVVGSTRIYEALGDQRAREVIAVCLDLMQGATEAHKGTVIKTIGDEVMATFPTADDAMNAAAQIQRSISTHPALQIEGQSVSVRIGCHFGPVVLERHDVFGATVNTANRMTSQAKSGQIVTTAQTVALLSPEWRASVRQIDLATLSVQGAEVMLYEALWQNDDITSMLPSIHLGGLDRKAVRLRLLLSDREMVLDESRPQVAIGRADENDLIIRGNLISRIHARIELSRSKFLLVDQSTNGTFVVTSTGEEAFVRRDSMQLRGSGMIGLGKVPEPDSAQTIRFVCEES
ncbi:MAG: adenylate/guanylate cyclase domain-containing protein [Pseudomonadota bacterium]|jgi:adenylate cyclase|nr:MAG: adenylate/guanylate cyclase domain-containing protein [Pseudomonadota bacterium]